jgi:hypothetical protein
MGYGVAGLHRRRGQVEDSYEIGLADAVVPNHHAQ